MSAPLLLMVQVDDATGEVLQDVCEQLHRLGARNVQLLASLGKKGRPGHVLLVDLEAHLEDEAALLLGTELGAWGYRVLESRHRHFEITKSRCAVRVRTGDRTLEGEVGLKRIAQDGRTFAHKVEHDDLVRLRDRLAADGLHAPLKTLRAAIESAARIHPDAAALDVVLADS